MHVQRTDGLALSIDDEQLVDAVLLHELHRFDGERVRADGVRLRVHGLLRLQGVEVGALFDQASQIAVGDDARQHAVRIDHGGHAQALAGDFHQRGGERRLFRHAGHGLGAAHHIAYMGEQFAPQAAAGMGAGEIFGAEAAGVEQGDGQGVTQGKLGGGAGGGREVERAGFLFDGAIEQDVGMPRQGGVGAAGHADERGAQALDLRHDAGEFFGLAGVGQGEEHIVARHHAEVAMAGLGRVHEISRRAGGGEGRRDFSAHMPRLAHARHHHAAGTLQDALHRLRKCARQRRRGQALTKGKQGAGFDIQGVARELNRALRRVGGVHQRQYKNRGAFCLIAPPDLPLRVRSPRGGRRFSSRCPDAWRSAPDRRRCRGRVCASAASCACSPFCS